MPTTFAKYPNGLMDRYELRRIMWTWPILMRQATDEKIKKFAYYIWERSAEAVWLIAAATLLTSELPPQADRVTRVSGEI